MTPDWLVQHWALVAAVATATAALVVVAVRLWLRSRAARLGRALRQRRRRELELQKAARSARRIARSLRRLEEKAGKIAPKRLSEAEGRAQDARRLYEIAADQLLVAENHVRKIIVEEFPPGQHETLRRRHRLSDVPRKAAFSFDGSS